MQFLDASGEHMRLTVKAILVRFNGNKSEAIKYCVGVCIAHPRLKDEYLQLVDMIRTDQS